MKQFHFEFRDQNALCTELARIKRYCGRHAEYQPVFQIYTNELDDAKLKEITDCIEHEMPDAFYYGCLSCGNILDGEYSGADTIIACLVFEYDTTRYKVNQISCADTDYEAKLSELRDYCNNNAWIKSIEILTTAKMLGSGVLEKWTGELREDIHCVGGCSSNPVNEQREDTFVFSKNNGRSDNATIFFMLGGEDVHVHSSYILGYEPLGSTYRPTSVDGNIIHTLDNKPAFDVYRRYLKIANNQHFFSNALGFPMIMTEDGTEYLKVPVGVLEDESLVMSGTISGNSQIRLSYGNPSIILRNIDKEGEGLATFGPEAIRIFSCFTRKMYWGNENISKETAHFANIAPVTGFFTRGELLRLNKQISLLSATLVVIGLREGEPVPVEYHSIIDKEHSGIVSYEERLINYIYEATKELERTSITDGMTKLFNRSEIKRQISGAIFNAKQHHKDVAVVMLDIDNFKRINDTYGHDEGDNVICGLSTLMLDRNSKKCASGRWGGEEFMILLKQTPEKDVISFAEKLRQDFENMTFDRSGHQTVSIGVTMLKADDTVDSLCVRVDKALYKAKDSGKNRVELL